MSGAARADRCTKPPCGEAEARVLKHSAEKDAVAVLPRGLVDRAIGRGMPARSEPADPERIRSSGFATAHSPQSTAESDRRVPSASGAPNQVGYALKRVRGVSALRCGTSGCHCRVALVGVRCKLALVVHVPIGHRAVVKPH